MMRVWCFCCRLFSVLLEETALVRLEEHLLKGCEDAPCWMAARTPQGVSPVVTIS